MNRFERKKININNKNYNLYLPYSNLISKNKGSDYNDLKTTVLYFISVMGAECKYFNIDKFLEKVEHTKFTKVEDKGYGEYKPDTNEIVYCDTTSLLHELFHLSSSFNSKLCGFMTYDEDEEPLGMGINEGYTEYLFNRYFYKNDDNPYGLETVCAQLIENLIGADKMEELYFSGNLEGLITELTKYSTFDETMTFIEALDVLEMLNVSAIEDLQTKDNYIACKVSIEFLFEYLKLVYLKKLANDTVDNDDIAKFLDPKIWGKGCDVIHYEDGVQKRKSLVLADSAKYNRLLKAVAKIKGINQ